MGICKRQWLTVVAVARHEPALEVDAPHVVSRRAFRKRGARWRAAAAQLPLYCQSLAIEQSPDRARRRPFGRWCLTLEPSPHLHRTPGRMCSPHRKAPFADLLRNHMGMMHRCPRAIQQAFNARFLIAPKPLVTDPSAHTVATAYRRQWLLPLLGLKHKPHPFIHGTGLHPNHRQGPPCRSLDLLPMSSV